MNPWLLMSVAWLVTALLFTGLWRWCESHKNASWVDAAWSAGVGIATLVYALLLEGPTERRLLVAVLAGAWSIRLTSHLCRRIAQSSKEDNRYARMRELAGGRSGVVFFLFFQVQAFWVVLRSAPMLGAMSAPHPVGWAD
ncbi:MAG: DUF1295 domain-containing protein, partial [Planctomycetota bacterium]